MSVVDGGISRRTFLSANATVLASIGLGASTAEAARAAPREPDAADLARFRPVRASSTAYAATPAWFALDGLYETGVRGSGWRAEAGSDPQWIEVDLQTECRVEAITLTFEAKPGDPAFDSGGASDVNPRAGTTGYEVLSSYPVAYRVEVSRDGSTWTTAYRTEQGTGAVTTITLDAPVAARWVRLTATARATTNPLGVNGIQIFGTCAHRRPDATGWTDWGTHHEAPPPLRVGADQTVALDSGWTLTYDSRVGEADGARLARPGVDTSAWLPATVPGTVLAALVERGHLPDPVRGFGNLRVPEALSRHSWWYRRPFRLPPGLRTGDDRRVWLEFDGINHHAEIWLDGDRVGEMTHPFQRARFDVTAQLGAGGGEHALAVRIDPMPFPGNPGDRGPDGSSYTDAGSDMMNRNSPTYLAVSGWDWMPAVRDRVSGIWNHVRLRTTGPVLVGDPGVQTVLPDLPDTSTARVTVTVPVHNPSRNDRRVTVRGRLGGVRLGDRTVTVPAGGRADVSFADVPVHRPRLWWPNGYGEPHLYDLRLDALTGGTLSDRRTVRTGLRHIAYETIPGLSVPPGGSTAKTSTFPRQTGRYLRVQCDKRATGWGASMFTLTVADSADPGTDLALHRPATASSQDNDANSPDKAVDGDPGTRWSSAYRDGEWIQVDLGAGATFDTVTIVWETAFASELRILVSDDGADFREAAAVSNGDTPLRLVVNGVPVFCRGGSWGWDELLRRALPDRLPAAVALHRDLGFTMIRAWLGSILRDELFAECDEAGILVWGEFPSAWFLDPPDHDVYLAQAHDLVLRYRHHPSVALWCAKNEGDPSAAIDAGLRSSIAELTDVYYLPNSIGGPVRGSGIYGWASPENYFNGNASWHNFGFHTEIGMPTVPVEESMRNLLGIDAASDAGWPIGDAWFMHDWCTKGAQNPNAYKDAIDARLGESSSLGEFCRKAQLVNYETMRALFEAWNARLWHDANGVLLWMSHPAWHSTVWQVYDYDLDVNGTYQGARVASEMVHVQANLPDWDVIAVNHTATAIPGAVVTADLVDLSGRRLSEPRQTTLTAAASAVTAAFTVDWPDDAPAVHLLRLTLTDGSARVRSRNVYWRYRRPADLRALNDLAATTVRVTVRRRPGGLTARVTNTGRTVAAMLRLALRDKHTGERVLPATYDDNYLWLLPGETRQVAVTSLADHPAGRLAVTAEGYNVART
ncbi:discoidin domain-containing protein [Mangrovihabitans endophyticus]|uniref:Glycosyl hydrolase n=1 Tax=Mangrovihabitans endophyticus TaxID=1751298 RepID=A0A8J3C172_9ACTN|nr:discoidin domain-containing protein [Mangrovihabitans endophyticus]GGK96073.1 glycosyl hydrolase [Mangrovihabitans endophyticus]